MTTRSTILPRIAAELGGHTGTVASGDGTTAVLNGLIGASRDKTAQLGAVLLFMGSSAADEMRVIRAWDPDAGQASFASRSDVTPAGDTFALLPKQGYTYQQLTDAYNESLRVIRRSWRTVIPTRDGVYHYPLTALSWLRGRRDVDAILGRSSPCLLDNEDFELWPDGPAAAPAGWVLAGAAGSVARGTAYPAFGAYSADLTRAGTDVTLTQSVGLLDGQLKGAEIAARADAWADAADAARIGISDGIDTTWSTEHTGNSRVQSLSVTKTLSASATALDIIAQVNDSDATVSFGRVLAQEGTGVGSTLQSYGSRGYPEVEIGVAQPAGAGGPVRVVLREPVGRGAQLVIASRRPFAEVSTDAAETDCPEQLLEHATLYHLLIKPAKGRDRVADAREAQRHAEIVRELAGTLIDVPVVGGTQQIVLTGA